MICILYTIYYRYNDVEDIVGFRLYERNEQDGYQYKDYHYIKNMQNDIIGIMDNECNIVCKYQYDSWGNIISIKDNNDIDISNNENHIANINPFRYRSYYFDKETNLYYLNSRYYNPLW